MEGSESNRLSRDFDLKRKHIFILSSAGKPIFTRHGDEQELVTLFGLLQAVISIVNDSGDTVKCIRSKNRQIVYFLRHSLYFVMISSTGECETVLNLQLEFMYSLILVILTSHVHTILENNQSKDLRDLLGPESTRLLHASCANEITSPYISFFCAKVFCIPSDFRLEIHQLMKKCVETSGSALGVLLYDDAIISYYESSLTLETQDVQLLCHFVSNAHSLRSHDQNWVPICLPNFNSKAYMQAYMCKFAVKDLMDSDMRLSLVLIASVAESSAFKDLHSNRIVLEKELTKLSPASKLISLRDQQDFMVSKFLLQSSCLHFFYKYHPIAKDSIAKFNQGISSDFHVSLQSEDSQDRIWVAYQTLAITLRSGTSLAENTLPSSKEKVAKAPGSVEFESNILGAIPLPDHALNYFVLSTGIVIVALASSDSELYASFSGTINPLEACGLAKSLSSALRSDSANLFL